MTQQEIEQIKSELWYEDPHLEMMMAPTQLKVVAEGDSWFDYPFQLDILDNLKRNFGYKIIKLSKAGDTIENMVYGTKFNRSYVREIPQIELLLEAIRNHAPKVVLLSGGGNDIAGYEFESFLNHKDTGLSPIRENYVDYIINTVFRKSYEDWVNKIWRVDPNVHIILHGYGRAIPDGRGVINLLGSFSFIGPWFKPALIAKNYTSAEERERIVFSLLDAFNEMLNMFSKGDSRLHYVDLRNVINRDDWVNELHLNSDAFNKCAGEIDKVIKAI